MPEYGKAYNLQTLNLPVLTPLMLSIAFLNMLTGVYFFNESPSIVVEHSSFYNNTNGIGANIVRLSRFYNNGYAAGAYIIDSCTFINNNSAASGEKITNSIFIGNYLGADVEGDTVINCIFINNQTALSCQSSGPRQ